MNLISFLTQFSYFAILGLIFTECGIPIGFFFPGDSLLITSGILAHKGFFNLYILMAVGLIAALLGNLLGYYTGKKWGRPFFEKRSNFVFNPKNLQKTEEFYCRYGDEAVLLARFIPVLRTFVPILAGIAQMNYSKFIFYTITGAFLWIGLLTSAGYFLVQLVPRIEQYLSWLILVIIFVSALPLIIKIIKK